MNPNFFVANIDFISTAVKMRNRKGVHYEGQERNNSNLRITTLSVPDPEKDHDSIGISLAPDGKLNIAVADGVSETVLPIFASRTAVRVAINEMTKKAPSSDIFGAVHTELQRPDLKSAVETLIAKAPSDDSYYNHHDKLTAEEIDRYVLTSHYRQILKYGAYTSTNLALAQFDAVQGTLSLAIKGDAFVVVFHLDERGIVYQGEQEDQLFYSPNLTLYKPHPSEIIKRVQLEKGDVVLVCSDGITTSINEWDIYTDFFGEVLHEASYDSAVAEKLDRVLIHGLSLVIDEKGIADDVAAVAFQVK